jgi:hypothetical protein
MIEHRLASLVLLSILALSSAGILPTPSPASPNPAGLTQVAQPTASFELDADVITAADAAGGGHFTTSDILFVVIIVLAVIGLAAIL